MLARLAVECLTRLVYRAPRRTICLQKRSVYRPTLLALEARDLPSTITVLNNADSGAGSLRAAVLSANSGDTITFAPSISSITLTSGQIVINKSLTIQGPGSGSLAISGHGQQDRLFEFDGGTSTISGLTMTQGTSPGFSEDKGGAVLNHATLAIMNCVLSNNQAQFMNAEGGALWNDGHLDLNDCLINGNSGDDGGGIFNSFSGVVTIEQSTVSANVGGFNAGPGGIENYGTMTITTSTIMANRSQNSGGGIINNGTMSISDGLVGSNLAQGEGGGIVNAGTLNLLRVTVSNNSVVGAGGGIANDKGNLTIASSTITANEATSSGGGLVNPAGGGIQNHATLSISDSVVSGNQAPSGGGIANDGSLDLVRVTVGGAQGNTATLDGGGIDNLAGGVATLSACAVSDNQATGIPSSQSTGSGNGGGIYNAGNLALHSTALNNNSAVANGGGLYNAANSQAITDTHSSLVGNQAAGSGGGVWNGGNLVIHTGLLSHNSAGMFGGGIDNEVAAGLVLDHTRVEGNKTTLRGAGLANQGHLSATNDSFRLNVTAGTGGGVWTRSTSLVSIATSDFHSNRAASGGGLFNQSLLVLSHDTIEANTATKRGGGLFNDRKGIVTLRADVIHNNVAPVGKNIDNLGIIK
jgi:hypothetical protein